MHVSCCKVSADEKYLSAAADESADCFPLNFGSWYWKSLCKNKPQNEPLFFTPFQQQLSIFLSHCCTKGITKYTPLPLIADTKLQRLRKWEWLNSNAAVMVSLTNHNQLASIAWTCSKTSVEQRVNLNSYSENEQPVSKLNQSIKQDHARILKVILHIKVTVVEVKHWWKAFTY